MNTYDLNAVLMTTYDMHAVLMTNYDMHAVLMTNYDLQSLCILLRDRPYMSTTARAPIWGAKLGRKVVDSTYLGGKIRMYDGK